MTNKVRAFIGAVDDFLQRRDDAFKAFRETGNERYPIQKRIFINIFKDENPYVVDAAFELLNNCWYSGESDGFGE